MTLRQGLRMRINVGYVSQGGTPSSGLLNLNTASAEQLAALPGLGEKTAAAVVAYRAAHGKFKSVADLDRVEGVGPATLAKLEGLVEAR